MSSSIITCCGAATNTWKLGSRAASPSVSARRATVPTSSNRPPLSSGVSADVVEAIRGGRRPQFAKYDEQMVYELVTELNDKRTVSQPTYDRALAAFGLEVLIELTTATGFYTLVAMMLNTFDAPVPGDDRPLPLLRT